MNFENLNFKGSYRTHNTNGTVIRYLKNDVVLYKGKTYVANRTVELTTPEHGENGGWSLLGGGQNAVQFYWGETVPLDVNVGDEWFNTSTGKIYKYITDGDSEQWVNIY